MKARKLIIFAIMMVFSLPLVNILVYRPILLSMDNQLIKEAGKLNEGMTEMEVDKIISQPFWREIIDIEEAKGRGLPFQIIDKLQNSSSNSKIIFCLYYIPVMFEPPWPFFPKPTKTVIVIFYDPIGKLCYLSIENNRSSETRGGICILPGI